MSQELVFPESPVFLMTMIGLIVFLGLIVNLISILVFCKIFAKAGYHWAFGLLTLVPIVNACLPFFLAFADWPARKELRDLRQRLGVAPNESTQRM
jgi:hypothetical protein